MDTPNEIDAIGNVLLLMHQSASQQHPPLQDDDDDDDDEYEGDDMDEQEVEVEEDVEETTEDNAGISDNDSFYDAICISQQIPTFSTLYKVPTLLPTLIGVAAKSTEKKFPPMWKRWFSFCNTMNYPYLCNNSTNGEGLGLYERKKEYFSQDHAPPPKDFDTSKISEFFTSLTNDKVSPNTIDLARIFFNSHLKAEYYCRLKNANYVTLNVPKDIMVGHLDDVIAAKKTAQKLTAQMDIENNVDIQSSCTNAISEKQIRSIVENVLCAGHPTHPLNKISPLMKLNFIASFFSSQSICRRGEDHYNQMICQRYCAPVKSIGPLPGTVCSFIIFRKSKTNPGDKKQITCYAPHMDPMRDASAWHGMVWFIRFVVMKHGETMPDFLNYPSLQSIPTYRSQTKPVPMSMSNYRKMWAVHFNAEGTLDVTKKTHQWKGQGIREMKDACIATDDISRFVAQKAKSTVETEALGNHYLLNPPSCCVAERAGGNPKFPQNHWPAYAHVEVDEELLHLVPELSGLLKQRDDIHHKFNSCKDHNEKKRNQLYSAKGCVDAMIHDMKRFFQFCAARPVDPITFAIQQDSPSIQEITKYKNGSFRSIFNHPVFDTDLFQHLRQKIRAAENMAMGVDLPLSMPTKNEIRRTIQEEVQPHLIQLVRMQHQQIQLQNEQIELLKQQMRHLCDNATRNHNINPPSHHVSLQNTTQTTYNFSTQHSNPIQYPPNASNDILVATSLPRKRQRGVLERDILLAEIPRNCPRPQFSHNNYHVNTWDDFLQLWHIYKTEWRTNEARYGSSWRTDATFVTTNGMLKKHTTRQSFWSKRKAIFDYMDLQLAKGDDEKTMLLQAQTIYNSTPISCTGIRITEEVNKQFKVALGQNKAKRGRPRTRQAGPDDQLARFRHETSEQLLNGSVDIAPNFTQQQPNNNRNVMAQPTVTNHGLHPVIHPPLTPLLPRYHNVLTPRNITHKNRNARRASNNHDPFGSAFAHITADTEVIQRESQFGNINDE